MELKFDEKTIQDVMKLSGEARGVTLKTDEQYILKEKGEEGIKALEEELIKMGQPIKYKEIDTMSFYPIGLRVISLMAIAKVFNFDDQKIIELGASAPKISFIIKLFTQYFLSIRRTFEQVSKMWRRHYTVGDLVPAEIDEEKKTMLLNLENIALHPIFCLYLTGYFAKTVELVVKSSAECKETKCTFRGDSYHEYSFKW